MSNSYYQIYVKRIFRLVKTMVIKSEASAENMNRHLQMLGKAVDESDPRSWKYYMNLAGMYHQLDVPMTVRSIDTLEDIPFTVEMLKLHRATANEYQYGSFYYNELLNRYPDQESLILGILNPVPLEVAIAAKDHSILYYEKSLVEENEYSLMDAVQQWVFSFMERWGTVPYRVTDDLFQPALLGIMYANLPKMILNHRLAKCKTNEAHSFHIREYLASHGRLDRFVDYLSKKQQLFLYRNIKYIQRNVGKQEIFDTLVERILTERGLPLAEYDIHHNLTNQPDELYPDVEVRRKVINIPVETKSYTVGHLLDKQDPMARRNRDVRDDTERGVIDRVKSASVGFYKTKALESVVVDKSDSMPYTLGEVALNHWLYLSTHGFYQSSISVANPKTGIRMAMSAKEAFVTFLYCYNLAKGLRLTTIPLLEAVRVRRPVAPTRNELLAVVDQTYVHPSFADFALRDQPSVSSYISIEAFKGACREFYEAMLRHRELYANREHYRERGYVEGMVGLFYHNATCDLDVGDSLEDWFAIRGLAIPELSRLEADLLARDLLATVTGIEAGSTGSLKELQRAMLRIMTQLSSYAVHYLQDINSDAYRTIDWPTIRSGDATERGYVSILTPHCPIFVKELKAKGFGNIQDEIADGTEITVEAVQRHRLKLDTSLNWNPVAGSITYHQLIAAPIASVLNFEGAVVEGDPIELGQLPT